VSRFVGKLNFAPQDPGHPSEWKLENNFGFLRYDGTLIIAMMHGHSDGASIPLLLRMIFGHPFSANRFWGVIHDSGYRGYAIIVRASLAGCTPKEAVDRCPDLPAECFIPSRSLTRDWWDRAMVEAMRAMREPRWKRRLLYNGVRRFGASAFRPHRPR